MHLAILFKEDDLTFMTKETNFEILCKLFFEIHNPEQVGGQGPDIGPQYVSAIFYTNENQKIIAKTNFAINHQCFLTTFI